jgi:peptide/nickel transport system substrate-binding protein
MEMSLMDWAAYLDRLRKHDFEAAILGMVQLGPFSDLYLQLHSSQITDGQNYGAYSNPRVDRLLENIRTTLDPKLRRRLSLEVQKLLYDEMAMIPLFTLQEVGLVSRRVHGVYSSALWYQFRDWWLE